MVKGLTFSVVALATAALVSPASAQQPQLTYGAQKIVDSVTPQQLQQACARGTDGITQLVRNAIQEIKRGRGAVADTDGPMAGRVLATRCQK